MNRPYETVEDLKLLLEAVVGQGNLFLVIVDPGNSPLGDCGP